VTSSISPAERVALSEALQQARTVLWCGGAGAGDPRLRRVTRAAVGGALLESGASAPHRWGLIVSLFEADDVFDPASMWSAATTDPLLKLLKTGDLQHCPPARRQ